MTKVNARDRRAYSATSSASSQQITNGREETTTSKPLSKLMITDRDRQLMSFIGTGGLASLSQLQRLFWPQSVNPRRCRGRLAQLEEAGYLQSWFVDVLNRRGVLVFSLTQKGALNHFSERERAYFYLELPPRSELTQQFLGQEARLTLELKLPGQQKQLIGWKNEHQLRGESWQVRGGLGQRKGPRGGRLPDIPDAQALILDQQSGEIQSLAVEIDGQYYGRMLDQKLTELVKKGQPVLWVTLSAQRETQVRNRLAQLTRQPALANFSQKVSDNFSFLVAQAGSRN